jgi:anti-sigma factor RsiW
MRLPEEESAPERFDAVTCQQVVARLMDYLAGTLDIATALALHTHLRDCQECAAFLHTYQATIRATRALRNEDVPLALQHGVRSLLRDAMQPPPPAR